jgi:hypothetical protein
MKFRALLLAALAVLPTGCGFVGHTLGTVANAAGGLINTVTAPLHLADAPNAATEKAWREKTAALNRETAAKNDRSRTQAKRRH